AIKLRFNSGDKFAFVLGNSQPFEGFFYFIRNIVPTPFWRVTRSKIIANAIEIDFLQFIPRPMSGQRFAFEKEISLLTEVAHPLWLAFYVDDIIDGLLAQADPRITGRF